MIVFDAEDFLCIVSRKWGPNGTKEAYYRVRKDYIGRKNSDCDMTLQIEYGGMKKLYGIFGGDGNGNGY